MEADWSIELGHGLPQIVVPWEAEGLAWIDLRTRGSDYAAALQGISMTAAQPALAAALAELNSCTSPWFTSKCDAWTIDGEDEMLDPYEFDAADLAESEPSLLGCASYLDLIARDGTLFSSFDLHETLLRSLTQDLHQEAAGHARVDLVLRAARVHDAEGFAMTAYVTGCGLQACDALERWKQALARFTAVLHKR